MGIAIGTILAFAAIVAGAFLLGRHTGFAKLGNRSADGPSAMTEDAVGGSAAAGGGAGAGAAAAAAVTADDDSATQVDAHSHLAAAKGPASHPDSPTTSTAALNSSEPRHEMEDLESARLFFSRAKAG